MDRSGTAWIEGLRGAVERPETLALGASAAVFLLILGLGWLISTVRSRRATTAVVVSSDRLDSSRARSRAGPRDRHDHAPTETSVQEMPETLAAAPPTPRRRRGRSIRRSGCAWNWDRWRRGTRFGRWICATCGVEAYTMDGRPPRSCKRASRTPAL